MIRTVIFDLGKVIVPFDFGRGYKQMEGLCGLAAAEIPRRISTTDLVTRFESGLMAPLDFVTELSRLLGLSIGYERFCQIWSSIFLPQTLIPDAMLARLRQRYRLLLLSNTNPIHFEMIRANYSFLPYFHDLILSHEVKALKPSPAMYRAAIQKADCPAGQCFFTDDVAAYVEGAKKEGIDAVQFLSLEQLENDMRARGIQW